MPRKPRQFEIGQIYHVINRGVEKRKIFLKNQDYERFILGLELFNDKIPFNIWDIIASSNFAIAGKRLKEEREKNKTRLVDLLAFTLMPNHYHLILREIIEGGISFFMKKLGGYSTYFNRQYDRVGSLFQSRYKLIPVKDDRQAGAAFAYTHTNPVELIDPRWKEQKIENIDRAIKYIENYRWSSYRDYIGYLNFPKVIQRDFFLDFYGGNEKCRIAIEEWIRFKAKESQFILE